MVYWQILSQFCPVLCQILPLNIPQLLLQFSDQTGNAFVNLVSVDVPAYAKSHFERSVKKTLTIPEWLNNAALEKGLNFSQVLQDALKQRLQNA